MEKLPDALEEAKLKKIAELCLEKEVLLTYLSSKVKVQDWHGTADAAMDLREIEAKLQVLREA